MVATERFEQTDRRETVYHGILTNQYDAPEEIRMPRKKPLDRVREICLALPEATEKEAWGEPTFRVKDKIFAQYEDNHHGSGFTGLWCKAPDGLQEMLVSAEPERYYVPKYVGHKGWIGIYMNDAVDWKFAAELLADSYRMTAPKRLLVQFEGSRSAPSA